MEAIADYAGLLVAMLLLIGCSAFFSGSEAALFYLRRQDRRAFSAGNAAQRAAAGLLNDPDRLLTAVLFWNLLVNITYFAIASIVGLRLQRDGLAAEAGAFTAGALLTIIFFSEMLPKSVAVVRTRPVAALVGLPLAASVRALDPVLPVLRTVNLISRRLIWPRFEPEPYLDLSDLGRAIELSITDAKLRQQEQAILRNIVSLSEVRVDELMRPRLHFLTFRPPVHLADLKGRMPPSGYILVSEPESDEVTGAIPLMYLFDVPEQHLEHHAERLVYVPWSANAATALQLMQSKDLRVAAVVNEFGDTVGIVTFDDIVAAIFDAGGGRVTRLLRSAAIEPLADGCWRLVGMTGVRRLARHFNRSLPHTKSVTVAGVLQEQLQRMPQPGDLCRWGPFELQVLEVPDRGPLTVILRVMDEEDES